MGKEMGVERDRKVGAWTLYVYSIQGPHSLVRVLTAKGTHTQETEV